MNSIHSRHFIYTHWLRMNIANELSQWQALKEYKEKYDCSMTVFYYDYNPFGDKVIKLDCNQSLSDLNLDINSQSKLSFKRIKSKPTNISPYNQGINYFLETNLGIKLKEENNNIQKINKKDFIIVDVLSEFWTLNNIKEFDLIMKKEKWNVVKIKSDRGYHYQLYFGEGKQVDNRYEFAFGDFQYKSKMKDRLQRFINNKLKQNDINAEKLIGLKINSFESIYQFSNEKDIGIDIKCIGLILGIDKDCFDIYDFQRPLGQQFYSIKVEDLKKLIISGIYKPNYNQLTAYEKLELKRYLNKKIDKFNQLCKDENFRNIDMNIPHIQGITIRNTIIEIFVEKYSCNLDDYISCSIKKINDKELIKKLSALDLDNKDNVLDYISRIENEIDYESANKKLDLEEEKTINSLNKDDYELEMDYD